MRNNTKKFIVMLLAILNAAVGLYHAYLANLYPQLAPLLKQFTTVNLLITTPIFVFAMMWWASGVPLKKSLWTGGSILAGGASVWLVLSTLL